MVQIEDLAEPTFTPEVQEILGFMDAMGADLRLEGDAIKAQASAETGLSDFGPSDYEERMEVLLAAMREVPGLQPRGVVTFHAQVLQALKNRLLLQDLLTRHPEIHDVQLAPPVVIAGLPRTGTTHLHNLLAAHPGFRTLPYWESVEPFPVPGESPDGRRERTELGIQFMNAAMPLFPLMHEMTTDHVHEEIQLLAVDFSSMLFETVARVPAWEAYYRSHDQTPHYRYLRTMLQAMEWLNPSGKRWLLKSPQHLEQFPVLATVFPEATVVVTHRDPVSVAVSMTTMIAYTARMHAWPVDAVGIGRAWADRLGAMLDAALRDRDALPRSMDVRFDDFMKDDLAVARAVCALADEPITPAAEAAMQAYLDGHQRGRLGSIDYRAADVGLDEEELRARYTSYVERFL